MEVFIEIYKEGSRDEKSKKNYFHLWVPDTDTTNKEYFWDKIQMVIRDIEKGRHRAGEDRFPNWMCYSDY